jgi:type IV pilus assembly protein PilQ
MALAAVGLALALACSSGPAVPSMVSQEFEMPPRLTDVRVESGAGGSVVTLLGLNDAVYTAFMHTEPRALVVDLASVEIATENDLVMVYDGLVENVTVSAYGGSAGEALTRIEIALSQDASYEFVSTPDGLQAVLSPSEGLSAEAPASAVRDETAMNPEASSASLKDPWSDPQAEEIEAAAAQIPMAVETSPATALIGIEYSKTPEGVLIHLEADGSVAAMEAFTLEEPDRLVVDMLGLKSQVDSASVSVGSPHVARIRVGAHPDKVRVVIDGGEAAGGFEERRIAPVHDGFYLALGTGSELADALAKATSSPSQAVAAMEMPAAMDRRLAAGSQPVAVAPLQVVPNTAPAAAPASTNSQVYGIHYDSEPDYERLVILSDSFVDFEVLTPDPETVVISIRDATVAREATGRVFVEPKRPISLISTFQQPDVDVPEVRVVVKRAADLEPSILRRGSMLFVDFPNTGLFAAAPPAFATEAEWMAAGLGGGAFPAAVADEIAVSGTSAAESVRAMKAMQKSAAPAAMDASLGLDSKRSGKVDDAAVMEVERLVAAAVPVGAPAALGPPAAAEILEEGGIIDGKEYEGRRISLDFKDVPVTDVLRLIAEVSDLNLIAGDEVDGSVTIRLVDVPWDQALDVILLTKGLGFIRVGNVLRIAPSDILKAEEELRLQERRNKETLEDLVVKLQPVNYANVADMSELVKRLLTPRGTVNMDVRTNTLIMKDIPSVIDEATALVKAVDTETPQVIIEAKIVEAALDFSRELGSMWSAGTQPLEDAFDSSSGARQDLGGADFRFHDANNVMFGSPITSIPTGSLSLAAFVLDEDFNIDVQLQAAESTGDGKVISSPRVLTLDNREAEIQQGVSIPFQTFENGDAKLEFIDAVLSLLVTPHVTSDKTIIMKIEVTRNAPDSSVATPTGSPAIARAEARTECLVKDGQTLVIGGIYTVNETESEQRVPYLHRLPLIGAAFKNRKIIDQRKELLIFVTPRIVLASELAGS